MLKMLIVALSSVQLLSCVWLFVTPWTAVHQASLSIPELTETHIHWVGPMRCHPTISSFVGPFPSHLQSFPASGSLQMSQFFPSGGQSSGASASASVLPMNIQNWFPLGRSGWLSLQSKGLSRVSSNTTIQKHQFFGTQLSLQSNSHPYMTIGKTIALTIQPFVGKVMFLLFDMLSSLIKTFLPRCKCLLISWL